MLLKSRASTAFLLSSLSFLAVVSGAPQPCDCDNTVSSQTTSALPPTNTLADCEPSNSGALSLQPSSSSLSAPGSASNTSIAGAGPSQTNSTPVPTSSTASGNGNSTSDECSPSNTTSSDAKSTSSSGVSSGSKFVIYSDKYITNGLPDVSKVEGYNVFALSFLLSTGAADQAMTWQQLDDNTRKDLKSKYGSAGIKIIVSAFGSTETPTSSGADATKVANDMANWVKKYDVDGIDVDYEDLQAMNVGDGKAEEWLSTFTKTLRGQLPQGKYILTHAPLPPWFNSETYKGGGYQKVNKDVGDMIDWYNVQFYNQNDYTDCDSLLTKSKTKTSVFEIADSGVDKNKLVIGKPATAADASNGFMDTKTLAGCVSQAKQKGWDAGVMVWQYPNADSTWIKDVRGDTFSMGK